MEGGKKGTTLSRLGSPQNVLIDFLCPWFYNMHEIYTDICYMSLVLSIHYVIYIYIIIIAVWMILNSIIIISRPFHILIVSRQLISQMDSLKSKNHQIK